MAPSSNTARLKFLNEAARFYASSVPATGAHLICERNAEVQRQGTVFRDDRQTRYCKACGTLLRADVNVETSIITQKQHKRKGSKTKHGADIEASEDYREECAEPDLPKIVVTTCMTCYRFEKAPMEGDEPHARPKTASENKRANSGGRVAQTTPISKNASSKQRAKTRKGGLQALLQKTSNQEASKSSVSGLDLMDFMSQG